MSEELIFPIKLKPFNRYDWLKFKDVERCPYPPFRNDPNWLEWTVNDDKRMLLIALDRYAAYLTAHRVWQSGQWNFWNSSGE